MKTHAINLKPYQLTAANEKRLGMVCVAMKEQPVISDDFEWHVYLAEGKLSATRKPPNFDGFYYVTDDSGDIIKSPYAPGDVLVGREAWAKVYTDEPPHDSESPFDIEYKADTNNPYPGNWPEEESDHPDCGGWMSASKMPLEYARHRYTITEVQPLWLPEISEEDAVRCGAEYLKNFIGISSHGILKEQWQAHHKAPWESWVWKIQLKSDIL